MITVAFFPRRSLLAKIGDLLKASVEHTVQQLCNCAALLVDGSFYLVYLMLLGVGQTVISSIYLAVESVKAAFWLSVYAVIAAAYAWDADSVRQAFDICRAIRDIESNVQAWRASLQIRLDQRVAERRAAHARRLEAWENGYWSFAAACMIVDSRSAVSLCLSSLPLDVTDNIGPDDSQPLWSRDRFLRCRHSFCPLPSPPARRVLDQRGV